MSLTSKELKSLARKNLRPVYFAPTDVYKLFDFYTHWPTNPYYGSQPSNSNIILEFMSKNGLDCSMENVFVAASMIFAASIDLYVPSESGRTVLLKTITPHRGSVRRSLSVYMQDDYTFWLLCARTE